MIEKIIFFVEEPSAREALGQILPKINSEIEIQIMHFQCKSDFLNNIHDRLVGYKTWLPESWKIIVLIDRDDDDCGYLKGKLEGYATSAGFSTKTSPNFNGNFQVINRIIIEELEAWFFGDWQAVRTAYPKVPQTIPSKAPYRDPDAIAGGTWEALERIFQKAGYYKSGLSKIECARKISLHMNVDRNTSRSFIVFRDAIREVLL